MVHDGFRDIGYFCSKLSRTMNYAGRERKDLSERLAGQLSNSFRHPLAIFLHPSRPLQESRLWEVVGLRIGSKYGIGRR